MAGDTKVDPVASYHSPCAEYIFAAFIILVALVLRTYTLSLQSVWSDEYVCVAYLDAPTWSEFQDGYTQHDRYMPPVYHVLLYAWARLFGNSVITLRLLSVLLATASLCLIYALGKSLTGSKGALVALTLFAFSPEQIYHAQGIRCYSLVVFLALISTWTFLNMIRNDGMGWWIANAVVNTVLFYTHLFSILLLMTWALGILLWLRRHLRKIAVWMIIQAILVVPMVGIIAVTTSHHVAIGDQKNVLFSPLLLFLVPVIPFLKDASYLLDALPSEYAVKNMLTSTWQNGMRHFTIGISFFLFFLLTTVFIYTCSLCKPNRRLFDKRVHNKNSSLQQENSSLATSPREKPNPLYFLLLWLLVPALTLIAPIFLLNTSVIVPRFTIYAAPSLYLLTAFGVLQIHNRLLRRFLLYSTIACMVVFGVSATVMPIRGNYLALGRLLAADGNRHPIAAIGKSPLLASQIAYNGHLNSGNLQQVYSIDAICDWLNKNAQEFERVWLVVEETSSFENYNTLQAVERLLTEKRLPYVRKCFHGPQMLLAYDIHIHKAVHHGVNVP